MTSSRLSLRDRVRQALPGHSLTTRIVLLFSSSTMVLAVVLGLLMGWFAQSRLEQRQGERLAGIAYQMADKLDRGLFERYADIQTLAELAALRDPRTPVAEQRALLERLQRSFPEYAWIGLSSPEGRVIASTGGLLEGADVTARSWFSGGLRGPFVGDVHNAALLATLLPNPTGEPLRFVDLATPVVDDQGRPLGVLAAHLSWSWADEVKSSLRQDLDPREQIEILVLQSDGSVVLGTPALEAATEALQLPSVQAARAGQNTYLTERWPDQQLYLSGFARSTGYRAYPGLGWLIIVRQPTTQALLGARQIQLRIVLAGLGVGVVFAGLSWLIAHRVTRPLVAITSAADQLRRGNRAAALPVLDGRDEVAQLAHSLHSLVRSLIEQEEATAALNTTLDRRIAERTQDLVTTNAALAAEIAERQQAEAAQARLVAILEATPDLVATADTSGHMLYINRAGRQMLGLADEAMLGADSRPYTHPAWSSPALRELALPAAIRDGVWSGETAFTRTDGRTIPTSQVIIAHKNSEGLVAYFSTIARDITERKQLEQRLHTANALLSADLALLEQRTYELALLNAMQDALHACETVSAACTQLGGFLQRLFPDGSGTLAMLAHGRRLVQPTISWGPDAASQAWSGEHCRALISGTAQDGPCCGPGAALPAGHSLCLPLVVRGETVGVLQLQQRAAPIDEAKTQLARTVASQLDLLLSNLKLRETLHEQAIHDAVTGLYNRRYMEESLERELRRVTRSDGTLGIIMLDIDHFKRFNDTFGHDAGDTLLHAVGQFLQSHIRGADIACRYGGEEFTLILPDASPPTLVERAEWLRVAIKHLRIAHQGQPLGTVSVSLGIALFPEHGTTASAVLRQADAALYQAKRTGRDCAILAMPQAEPVVQS